MPTDRLIGTAIAMVERVKTICLSNQKAFQMGKDALQRSPLQRGAHGSRTDPSDSFHIQSSRDQFSSIGTGDVDFMTSLQGLTNRVKIMELDGQVPERHLFLLRDLRQRVVDVEAVLTRELETQRRKWSEERTALLRAAQENIDQVILCVHESFRHFFLHTNGVGCLLSC